MKKSDKNLESVIESLLFVAERPVTLKELAEVLGEHMGDVQRAVDNLTEQMEGRGIRVLREGEKFHLVSAPEYSGHVAKLLNKELRSDLSQSAIEVLAIVTYKQPVTKGEIEAIRGVNSENVVRQLLLRGLIEPKGRRDTIGRPTEYGTTTELLNHLGVTDSAALPELPELQSISEDQTTLEVTETTIAVEEASSGKDS